MVLQTSRREEEVDLRCRDTARAKGLLEMAREGGRDWDFADCRKHAKISNLGSRRDLLNAKSHQLFQFNVY